MTSIAVKHGQFGMKRLVMVHCARRADEIKASNSGQNLNRGGWDRRGSWTILEKGEKERV